MTVMVRVEGCGSELPLESIAVSETVYTPALPNVTLPGFCAVEVAGEPPGKIQEYCNPLDVVPKETLWPACIVRLVFGVVMLAFGGTVVYGVSCTICATEGTPALSIRNNM